MLRILNGFAAAGRCFNRFYDRKSVHSFIFNFQFFIFKIFQPAFHIISAPPNFRQIPQSSPFRHPAPARYNRPTSLKKQKPPKHRCF